MTLKLLQQNYNQTSKSTYFLLEAVLNLRPVEPALSHEKGAIISLATDACHTVIWFLTLFRVSHYIKKKPSIVFKSHQQITKFRQSILHSDIGVREKKNNGITQLLCWMTSVLINNYQMRLIMIWRVLAEANNTLLDLPNSSDQTKPVLLFIQNNS